MGSGMVFVAGNNNAQDLREVVCTEKSSARTQEEQNVLLEILVPSSIWCGGSETRS